MPLAQNLSLITDRMISVGLTKIRDLTYEDALLVLQELLPAGSPSSSFRIVADRFKPLSEARNLELMTLADQKHAFEAASDLALFWFDTYSDKSLKSLAKVAQQINGHGRDLFLAAGALTFPQLKVDEVKSLVQLAVTDTGSVGAAAMTKVSEIDSRDIIDVYTPMDDANRGDFLVKVVPLYKTIQPSEIKTFLRATLHRRGEIAKLAAPNIDGIRYDSVIEIAGLIEDAAKDDVLYILIPKVGALNIDQVIQLMDAAHVGQFNVVKLARPSLVDLNVSGIITIAMKLAGSNRDEWIISAIPALGETSPEDLQVLMKTSSQGALQISQILLPKIKAILTTQIAAIAELLTGAEKDVWILSVIPKLEKLYAEGLLKIIHASYAKGYEVAMALIPKLQEFEVSEALQLAKEFSGPSRDEILLAEIPKIKEIKAENVAELVAMAYQRQSDIKLLAQSQVHTAP